MTPVTCMQGRKLAIFGLGASGLATARALRAGGATPILWDDAQAKIEEARVEGFEVEDLHNCDWRRLAALVLAPGVPLTHPKPHWTVGLAKAQGVEVIGDIELFCRERQRIAPGSPFIAITGTNGKSTTTALIAHILREAQRDVQMGGNIGVPILALEPPSADRFHVIECSSFQIDLSPSLAPKIGVLLNITPDHLDRHGAMENYAAIKEKLVESSRLVVIGTDDALSASIFHRFEDAERPALAISAQNPKFVAYTYFDEGRLQRQIPLGGRWCLGENLVDISQVKSLRGRHNGQNAAAAFCVCDWLHIPHDVIGASLRSFPGLAHRMEEVGRSERVTFVNDSKATNADSTEKALLCFEGGIFWILGGKPKEGGIEPLRPLFPRIERAYLIGAATEAFAATLAGGKVAHERCGTLDKALAAAARDAALSKSREPVVLLSPASASYDQFKNFEERGDRFRELVQEIVSQAQADARITSPLAGEVDPETKPKDRVRDPSKVCTRTPHPEPGLRSAPTSPTKGEVKTTPAHIDTGKEP
ncbi:MAG: UDP-N-acetylmuramoyl-L-alanine--D-glutamate ligase [Hyphomicrobiales bacterium]